MSIQESIIQINFIGFEYLLFSEGVFLKKLALFMWVTISVTINMKIFSCFTVYSVNGQGKGHRHHFFFLYKNFNPLCLMCTLISVFASSILPQAIIISYLDCQGTCNFKKTLNHIILSLKTFHLSFG